MTPDVTCLACHLCGLAARTPCNMTISGQDFVFCCQGCSNVYQILVESGSFDPGDDPSTNPIYRHALALGLLRKDAPQEVKDEGGVVDDLRQCVLQIDGMWCTSCAWLITHALLHERGVSAAEVSFASDTARVTYRPARIGQDDLIDAVKALGYHAETLGESSSTDPRSRRRRADLIRASLTFFFAMNVMMYQISQYAGYRGEAILKILFALSVIVLILAFPIFRRALAAARHGHATMDTLVSLGSLSAFSYSVEQLVTGGRHIYFDTSCMLLALVMVGKYIESGVRANATDALTTLYGLIPRKASVLLGDDERPVAIDRLAIDDLFRVRSGERVAADGVVQTGSANVDESLISGESWPVRRIAGDVVTGGSIVVDGVLDIRVSRTASQGSLSQMIAMVETAMRSKTPAEQWADRISRIFVPCIIGLALITLAAMLLTGHEMSAAMTRAVAVLVIACPCALGIATPMAMSAGVGAAARKGILISDGAAFERLCKLRTIVLDKTGSATEGRFAVHAIEPHGADVAPLAALETMSEHPIARAIVRELPADRILVVTDFCATPGLGVSGRMDGALWFAGNTSLAQQCGSPIPLELSDEGQRHEASGLTVLYWGRSGEQVTGMVALGDQIRAGARELVVVLAQRGIETQMVSGDAEHTVRAVAERLGIRVWRALARPQEKAAWMKSLRDSLPAAALTGMIGDGVNDAPALAQADIGIAMATGADLASHAAQITLLTSDLTRIAELLDLAAKTARVMRQNLFWACLYNVVCIPLAMLGFVSPIWAAVAMMVSSTSVIINTRRVKWL